MTEDRNQKEVQARLAPFGLFVFGRFQDGLDAGLLVGNIGSSHWDAFRSSDEYKDGELHPMDRWSRRVVTSVAGQLYEEIRFPFGEKIWPFQRYAQAATGMKSSPIGLLIHEEFGLWTAFRAALMFKTQTAVEQAVPMISPCDTCVDKPCLTSCPVSAFSDDGYDYARCKSHVKGDPQQRCRTGGCAARRACPVARSHAYREDHQAFHMNAFA